MFLDIAEVARRTGVPASTLRFYEEKELIRSVGRRGLKRLFAGAVIQRLALIALGVRAGFSLQEIGDMLPEDGGLRIDRELLLARADELDDMLARLAALRDALRHTANCPAPNHLECPTFQKMLSAAARTRQDKRKDRNGMQTS